MFEKKFFEVFAVECHFFLFFFATFIHLNEVIILGEMIFIV